MKKVMMVALVWMLSGALQPAQAEPLAPLANLDGMFEKMKVVSPAEREVPDASKVGIPAYPGSLFCTVKAGSMGKTAWSEVQLLSTDPYEKVTAWYRQKMGGWFCNEWSQGASFSCSDKDPGPAGYHDPETANVVNVSKTDVAIPCALPGVQTGIIINFQPD